MDPVSLANAHADPAAFERAVLDALGRDVGFDVSFFAVKDAAPTTIGIDGALLSRALRNQAYEHELAPLKQAAFARRNVVVDTELFGEEAVRRKAYHREIAAPVGGTHGLLAFLVLRGRPFGVVLLGRSSRRFDPAEVRRVEGLLPGIALGRASFHASPPPAAPLPRRRSLQTVVGALRGEHVLARVATPEGAVVVRDRRRYREMVERRGASELVWSRVDLADRARSGFFYVDLFHLAPARAARRDGALFVGCGGGVALHQFARVYPEMAIELVEPDQRVVDLAASFFGLHEIPRLAVHVAEGASFLERLTEPRFDVIVIDAYDGCALPEGFATRRFFASVRRALRPGGAVAFNVVGALRGDTSLTAVEQAARAELADVRLVPVLDPGEDFDARARRNVIVLASRRRS